MLSLIQFKKLHDHDLASGAVSGSLDRGSARSGGVHRQARGNEFRTRQIPLSESSPHFQKAGLVGCFSEQRTGCFWHPASENIPWLSQKRQSFLLRKFIHCSGITERSHPAFCRTLRCSTQRLRSAGDVDVRLKCLPISGLQRNDSTVPQVSLDDLASRLQ